jgi:hypothetical protein
MIIKIHCNGRGISSAMRQKIVGGSPWVGLFFADVLDIIAMFLIIFN